MPSLSCFRKLQKILVKLSIKGFIIFYRFKNCWSWLTAMTGTGATSFLYCKSILSTFYFYVLRKFYNLASNMCYVL